MKKYITNNNKQPTIKKKQKKKTTRIKTSKQKTIKIIIKKNKPSTVAPEYVTLNCSLTHVLQVPNTQPYHH